MEKLIYDSKQINDIIDNLVLSERISHAYLIEINDCEQDFNNVVNFVKLLFCKNKKTVKDLNCMQCNICSLVDTNNYPDFRIIEPEGREIKKRQIMDLQTEFSNKSLLGNKRIYLIKFAENLNESASNTLLKFLEEPENDIIAFLITTNKFKVLDTLVSRCQFLSFRGFNKFELEQEDIEFLKILLNGKELFLKYNYILDNILPDKNIAKDRLKTVQRALVESLYSNVNFCSISNISDVFGLISELDKKKILALISIIDHEILKLDYNVNYKLWLDSTFAKMIGGVIDD